MPIRSRTIVLLLVALLHALELLSQLLRLPLAIFQFLQALGRGLCRCGFRRGGLNGHCLRHQGLWLGDNRLNVNCALLGESWLRGDGLKLGLSNELRLSDSLHLWLSDELGLGGELDRSGSHKGSSLRSDKLGWLCRQRNANALSGRNRKETQHRERNPN